MIAIALSKPNISAIFFNNFSVFSDMCAGSILLNSLLSKRSIILIFSKFQFAFSYHIFTVFSFLKGRGGSIDFSGY